MTSLASPHGLAVVGALFMLGGLAILGAALFNRTILSSLTTTFDSPAKLGVAAWFALPMLALGLFLQAAGNMAAMPIGPGLTMLLLALGFALLLYVALDETIAEALERKAAPVAAEAEADALPAAVREVITEVAKSEPEKTADAPKIALVS